MSNTWFHGLRTPREEIAFTARPKIHSHSQVFRYGQSIFCLPHRPKFSDFFDLCLHWVSVVRENLYWNKFWKLVVFNKDSKQFAIEVSSNFYYMVGSMYTKIKNFSNENYQLLLLLQLLHSIIGHLVSLDLQLFESWKSNYHTGKITWPAEC